ncbi:MAG TPA: hypothetical protein PKW33_00635 [Anaerolineaceae bacterium]|nr:hypothetical protein [Anaerolineaceae bacterium]HPN50063.1 hypothetical protein [Anaerolineaceae bacterium]
MTNRKTKIIIAIAVVAFFLSMSTIAFIAIRAIVTSLIGGMTPETAAGVSAWINSAGGLA